MSRSPCPPSPLPKPAAVVERRGNVPSIAVQTRTVVEGGCGVAHGASFSLMAGVVRCYAVTSPVLLVCETDGGAACVYVNATSLPTVRGHITRAWWTPAEKGCAYSRPQTLEPPPWYDTWALPRGRYQAAVFHHRIDGVLVCASCGETFGDVRSWRAHTKIEGSDVLLRVINGRLHRHPLVLAALRPVPLTGAIDPHLLTQACLSSKRRRLKS